MHNQGLASLYNKIYKKGEKEHYTSLLFAGDAVPLAKDAVLKEIAWKGKTVLDAGCGTGELAYLIAKRGALKVLGVDYSTQAIAAAKKTYKLPHLEFRCADIIHTEGAFDVVTSLGTVEHMDDPLLALRQFKFLLRPGGSLIITCPNWTNARGYILQTLRMLFDAKITLADMHFFTPIDFEKFSKELGMRMTWKTVEQEWGHGKKCITDFKRRLPRVMADSKLPVSKKYIDAFIKWLEVHMVAAEEDTLYGGAVGLYHFHK